MVTFQSHAPGSLGVGKAQDAQILLAFGCA